MLHPQQLSENVMKYFYKQKDMEVYSNNDWVTSKYSECHLQTRRLPSAVDCSEVNLLPIISELIIKTQKKKKKPTNQLPLSIITADSSNAHDILFNDQELF